MSTPPRPAPAEGELAGWDEKPVRYSTTRYLPVKLRARRVLTADPENLEQAIVDEINDAVAETLGRLGKEGTCRGCGATIWWVKNAAGKSQPYSRQGISHFADCPKAAEFRKKREAQGLRNRRFRQEGEI
jgi:hypothetical protein